MSHYKDFTKAVSLFVTLLSCCSAVFDGFIPAIVVMSDINCTDKAVKQCQSCPKGTFANESILECDCCIRHNRSGQCLNTTCEFCPPGFYQNKTGQRNCLPCDLGTNCSTKGCTDCSTCPKGHEARQKGTFYCTECDKGHFKPENSSELCRRCSAGTYTNMTGQTKCIRCPSGYYCPAGAFEPIPCDSSHVCPAGSGSPGECEPPWREKDGDECVLSTPLIIVICVILIPIALAVIIVILYKLYKYWKWHRHQEILGGERAPLLSGSRSSSRIEEPVYSGL